MPSLPDHVTVLKRKLFVVVKGSFTPRRRATGTRKLECGKRILTAKNRQFSMVKKAPFPSENLD